MQRYELVEMPPVRKFPPPLFRFQVLLVAATGAQEDYTCPLDHHLYELS